MKKKFLIYTSVLMLAASSCKKSDLQLLNPNNPTPGGALVTEGGIESFGLGIYQKWIGDVSGEGASNIWFLATFNHSLMGDEAYSPYGNFGWRYIDQVYAVTLPAPYNNKVITPIGSTQQVRLKSTNSVAAGELNSFLYEWQVAYAINSQANLLLQATNNSALVLAGDAAVKKATLQAWAYWWKGVAYSRIGSMYTAGVINNAPADGTTNGNFVSHDAIITEANANFTQAANLLKNIAESNADYQTVMKAIIPAFNDNVNLVSPAMWVRHINTYMARNYLVNHKVASMTAADWNQITTLANAGIQQGDNTFKFGMDPGAVNDLSANFFHPFAIIADGNAFSFVSERLIQDYKSGDQRLAKGFKQYAVPKVNERSRGLQFGTRWSAVPIESGGLYATNNSAGNITFACSWEENALMLAEAKIRTGGDVSGGLTLIDQVRRAQGAGLATVAGAGLTQTQAIEELRRERRVGLFLRGLAFYDARRWGVTAPASQGGGRSGAIVMVPGSLTGSSSAQPLPCFMEYSYLDYFDVPQNELDFNKSTSSTPLTVPVAQ